MSTHTLWRPRSPCGTHCLPPAAAVPRVGRLRAAGRIAGVVAVMAMAVLVLPLLAVLPRRRRSTVTGVLARCLLAALGVRHTAAGRLPRRGALLVANHVSWLDVLVILAHTPARLLAKRDVRDWPVVGALARAAGTVFVDRSRPRTLPGTVAVVAAALRGGGVVAAFPEGTTWCGTSSGTFRPALFQAAVDSGAPVAPVTLRFRLADDSRTTIAAFIGEDSLLASLLRVVRARGLRIVLRAHPPLYPEPAASRRVLARAAGAVVHTAVDGPSGATDRYVPVGFGAVRHAPAATA